MDDAFGLEALDEIVPILNDNDNVRENDNDREANANEEDENDPDMRNEEEWVDFVAEQLAEWNVTQDELYGLVAIVHSDYNEFSLRGSPLIQPAIMRCIVENMDFETLKNLRQSAKTMKTMVDPYFYKRGSFKIKDSAEFYRFIKKPETENPVIPTKMRRVQFTEEVDLFEVSRVMYRARTNLKELSVFTTAPKLRGEFQNIAGVLPYMEKLHTLRLCLPRRYLLHQLFTSTPLTKIKTLYFNFESAHASTINGIFNTCTSLEFLEVVNEQMKSLPKLTALVPFKMELCNAKKSTNSKVQIYKIVRDKQESGESNPGK